MDRMQYEAAMGADPKPSIPPGLPSHVTEGPSSPWEHSRLLLGRAPGFYIICKESQEVELPSRN